jgi:hypothetical protein
MGRWIFELLSLIARCGNHSPLMHDHSTDRDFPFIKRLPGHFQSLMHPTPMGLKRICQEFHHSESPASEFQRQNATPSAPKTLTYGCSNYGLTRFMVIPPQKR